VESHVALQAIVPAAGFAALARLEQATRVLAELREVDEVKAIIDLAEAARVYAETARLGTAAINHATEIKLRAERRAGELLRMIPREPGAGGGRPPSSALAPVPTGLESTSESESEKTSSQPGTRFSVNTHGDERAHPHALSRQSRTPYEVTLRNAQITRGTADRWQRVAGVPDHAFEAYIAEARARASRLTTRDVMRLAPPPISLRPEPVNLGMLAGTVPWTIEQGDAARLPLPDGTVQVIVSSPPYGLGKNYDFHDDDQSDAQYLGLARTWAAEMFRVSRPQGRLCLNVPLDISRGGEQPLYADWLALLRDVGWTYQTTIAWLESPRGNVRNSIARGSIDSPSAPHVIAPIETIIVCSRGEWSLHRSDASNLSHAEWLDWTNGVWIFSAEQPSRVKHPAPFPEELPRRLIKLFSFPGDPVLDPFVGSGTTSLVAQHLGRPSYGYDISAQYVADARARLHREAA
jgi:site-specific DNA-methyltransferase (adenine-specific)